MLIVESQSLDVYRNLAIEEYLMERVTDRGPVLFLWRSRCAVVMGKNQNPWRECRLDVMRDENVPLARRVSGGGTVYHDEGNLNYCVIVDRTQYREEQAYELVLQALKTFGIHAAKTGKSNLCVDGLKFSGNAFCFRRGRALHHGTLLLNTDLERLGRYLGSMLDGIETRAVASVPAKIMNLDLDLGQLSAALMESFCSLYGSDEPLRWRESDLAEADVQALTDRYVSDGWKYGATPKFVLKHSDLRLEVEKGQIIHAEGARRGDFEGKPFARVAFSLPHRYV